MVGTYNLIGAIVVWAGTKNRHQFAEITGLLAAVSFDGLVIGSYHNWTNEKETTKAS